MFLYRKTDNKRYSLCFLDTSVHYLSNTLWTSPVPLGHFLKRWDQTEGVVAVVTTITQQEPVLLVTSSTHHAEIKVDLRDRCHRRHKDCQALHCTQNAMNNNNNIKHNDLALTKLTSRVSLRGLILIAKAWALR